MKKFLIILLYVCVSLNIAGQRNDVFENRFRNPIDTTTFHTSPTILLFVHSQCGNGHLCATTRMQKALEKDSLQIRKERAIKLYVVYPKCYDIQDINTFDTFNPVNTEVVFYTDTKYKGVFSEGNSTPYAVIYDGNGNIFKGLWGTYEKLCEFIKSKIPIKIRNCPKCKGTGNVKPVPKSGSSDLSIGICPMCGGSGNFRQT